MVRQIKKRMIDCIAVDLNTQQDFCSITGTHPVSNQHAMVKRLRCVMAWVKRYGVPIVSSLDSQRAAELEGGASSRHRCVDGSIGQRKIGFTLFPLRTNIEVDNTLAMPFDLLKTYQQLIFRSRTSDLLHNPKADRFFTNIPANEFVLFGNTLEESVKAMALGLLARHKQVTIVRDACGYWSSQAADLAVRQIAAKGANVLTVDELLLRRPTKRSRYRMIAQYLHLPSRNGLPLEELQKANGHIRYGGAGSRLPLAKLLHKMAAEKNHKNEGSVNGQLHHGQKEKVAKATRHSR